MAGDVQIWRLPPELGTKTVKAELGTCYRLSDCVGVVLEPSSVGRDYGNLGAGSRQHDSIEVDAFAMLQRKLRVGSVDIDHEVLVRGGLTSKLTCK
jgi:hypothetical protein